MHKDILRRLLAGFCVLLFPALLLGLTRYSYRAKELLVCWLLFCSLFALLAVLFLGSVLACYAAHHLLNWMRVAKTVIPELAVCMADIPQEAIPDPRILAAGTFKLSADTYATVDALDSDACLSIEVAPSAVNKQKV
jgi:hypothetical protein